VNAFCEEMPEYCMETCGEFAHCPYYNWKEGELGYSAPQWWSLYNDEQCSCEAAKARDEVYNDQLNNLWDEISYLWESVYPTDYYYYQYYEYGYPDWYTPDYYYMYQDGWYDYYYGEYRYNDWYPDWYNYDNYVDNYDWFNWYNYNDSYYYNQYYDWDYDWGMPFWWYDYEGWYPQDSWYNYDNYGYDYSEYDWWSYNNSTMSDYEDKPWYGECVGNYNEFDAGYGQCYTYNFFVDNNYNFCNGDFDDSGVSASQVCAECGSCDGPYQEIPEDYWYNYYGPYYTPYYTEYDYDYDYWNIWGTGSYDYYYDYDYMWSNYWEDWEEYWNYWYGEYDYDYYYDYDYDYSGWWGPDYYSDYSYDYDYDYNYWSNVWGYYDYEYDYDWYNSWTYTYDYDYDYDWWYYPIDYGMDYITRSEFDEELWYLWDVTQNEAWSLNDRIEVLENDIYWFDQDYKTTQERLQDVEDFSYLYIDGGLNEVNVRIDEVSITLNDAIESYNINKTDKDTKILALENKVAEQEETIKNLWSAIENLEGLFSGLILNSELPEEDQYEEAFSCESITTGADCKAQEGCKWKKNNKICIVDETFVIEVTPFDCPQYDGNKSKCQDDELAGICEWKKKKKECWNIEL